MSRQGGDPTMVSSSIALLQERFRQLQKVREKREEKELLKLFSEPDRAESITRCEPNGLLSTFAPEMAFPSRQPQQDSLALGLNSLSRQNDFRAMGIPTSMSSSNSKYYEHSDVDTSLHL